MPTVSLPLVLSYDTRATLAYAAIAKDQRRVNCYYELPRPMEGQPNVEAALVRRPGVTDFGSTYGSAGQTQYLTCPDPTSGWTTPAAWVFTKDASNVIKAHSASTSISILTSADYVPRFVDITNVNGTNTAVLQLQNTASPEGAPSQRVYYSSAIATWTEITDADFTALKLRGKMEFRDGYAFIADGNGRVYQPSINSLSAWNPVDYLTRGVTQDPTQGLAMMRGQIIIFGRETAQAFTNQGNATGSVLGRVPFAEHAVGLAGTAGADGTLTGKTHYYARLGNFIFLAGRYGGSAPSVNLLAYDGHNFVKISRTYEDKILSSTEVYSVNKISFMGKVGIAFQLTAPTVAAQKALVFFPDINDWFEWESSVFSVVNNGVHFLGTTDPQKLYHCPASNNYQDAGTSFSMIAQIRLPRRSNNRMWMSNYGVVADTVASNNLSVEFSDDDGASFSTARTIDLGAKLKRLHRGGMFRERLVRLTHTGSGEVRLHRFYYDAMEGAL